MDREEQEKIFRGVYNDRLKDNLTRIYLKEAAEEQADMDTEEFYLWDFVPTEMLDP